jgi:hypothetical protein
MKKQNHRQRDPIIFLHILPWAIPGIPEPATGGPAAGQKVN